MSHHTVLRHRRERGSALLIVFVFAAIIAIYLYKELPVAAFEAKRNKEQLLIDRGNEYAHAVKLFYRATRTYPQNFEALENTNRIRFLRRRYVDPFTGKDDWRLLHAGPNGMLLDSKVNPVNANAPGNQNSGPGASGMGTFNNGPTNAGSNSPFGGFNSQRGQQTGQSGGFGSFGGFGSQNTTSTSSSFGGYFSQSNTGTGAAPGTPGEGGAVPNVPQRPPAISANGSDEPTVGAPTDTAGNPESAASAVSPSYIPRSRRPTQADLMANRTGQTSIDAASTPPAEMLSTGSSPPGVQGQTGVNTSTVAPSGVTMPAGGGNVNTGAGVNPAGGFGANTNTGFGANANAGFGANVNTGANSSPFGAGPGARPNAMGVIQSGGIAGVASKAKGTAIKEVNEQDDYSLWEFYYDPSKDAMRGALAQTGAQGTRTGQAQPNATGPGANTTGAGANSFGTGSSNSFGFGGFGNSGFGNRANTAGGFNSTGSGPGNTSGFGNRNPQTTMPTDSSPP